MLNDKRKTILLVEDQKIIAMVEKMQLESFGYQVEIVDTGEQAVELMNSARGGEFDLILMDIDLGEGIDGTEAARIILTQRELPLIFLSSHTEPEIVNKTEGITSYGYIVKNSGQTVLDISIKMAFRLFEARRSQRNVQQELLHSRDLMNYIIEHNSSAVAVHDRDLNYIYVSQRYLKDYRVTESDIIGRNHYDVFPDLPQKWRDVHQRALRGEISSATDDPYLCDDGRVEWTRWECRPWFEADGSIGGVIVYTEITTERKQIELTLAAEKERLKVTLNSIGDGMISTDINGNVDFLNPIAQQLTGWTEKEARGRPLPEVFNIVSAITGEKSENPVTRVLETGKIVGLANHTILIDSAGREYQIADSAAPILNAAGEIIGVVLVFRNVTEAYALQQALKESEKRHRRLFETMNQGVIYQSSTGGIISANPAAHRILGNKLNCREKMITEDKTAISQNQDPISQAFATGEKIGPLIRGIVNSDTLENLWIQITATPLFKGEESSPHQVYAIIEDVTELKQLLDRLKISDRIFRHSIDMLCVAGFDGYFKVLNPAWSKTLGYSTEELLSRPWLEFVYSEDQNLTENIKSRLINGVEVYQFENRYLCKDGRLKWLSWNSFPYPEEGIMFGVARDITESKLAQQKLKESEDRFKALHNASFGGIVIHDRGIILECNQGLAEISGFSTEELIGMDGLLLIAEKSRQMVMNNILSGYELPYEAVGVRKNGEEYPVRLEARMIPYRGKTVRVVEFRDITREYLDRQQIQSLVTEKQLLLKETHHRIKNNMGMISGLLTLQANRQNDKTAAEILTDAAFRVQSMMTLYQKLYHSDNFNRLGVREFVLPLIDQIMSIFSNSTCSAIQPIQTSISIDDFILNTRQLSPLAIIINELLTNSIKHAFDQIKQPQIFLKITLNSQQVTVEYRDNGVGIPQQTDKPAGFGMQIIEMLTAQIKGDLTVENSAFGGFTCLISFKVKADSDVFQTAVNS